MGQLAQLTTSPWEWPLTRSEKHRRLAALFAKENKVLSEALGRAREQLGDAREEALGRARTRPQAAMLVEQEPAASQSSDARRRRLSAEEREVLGLGQFRFPRAVLEQVVAEERVVLSTLTPGRCAAFPGSSGSARVKASCVDVAQGVSTTDMSHRPHAPPVPPSPLEGLRTAVAAAGSPSAVAVLEQVLAEERQVLGALGRPSEACIGGPAWPTQEEREDTLAQAIRTAEEVCSPRRGVGPAPEDALAKAIEAIDGYAGVRRIDISARGAGAGRRSLGRRASLAARLADGCDDLTGRAKTERGARLSQGLECGSPARAAHGCSGLTGARLTSSGGRVSHGGQYRTAVSKSMSRFGAL